MRTISRYTLLVLTILILASCSKFRKIQKSPDWRLKYDAALEYYENEKYNKATLLLEEILPIIRGTKEAELGNYYFAYAYFHQKQYILSAHHFDEFVRVFGRSEYAMEATYLHAYSVFLQSPEYNLDQTSTYEAVNALQAYMEKYPASERVLEADSLIGDLQIKLETKAYYNAKLFHKIKRFKAALVIFNNFHKDFPDSDFREEIDYLAIKTTYEYARVSIKIKQEERFREAIARYEGFIDKYPQSEFIEDAEEFFVKSREELAKFADQNKKNT
ncbi:MAG: outer membrane protein assembly factor BamD [Cytophagales bacterium]|nr:outer membrane protein assembly factor BamD [Cytophagales bacterium]